MSLPDRPGGRPSHQSRNSYRQSPARRNRPADVEAGGYYPVEGRHQRGQSLGSSFGDTIRPQETGESLPLSPSPDHADVHDAQTQPFQRKRSLIRPERNRIGKDHPNYHYRKHAANMNTIPSSTGNDPILEDLEGTTDVISSTSHSPRVVSRSRTNSDEVAEKRQAREKTRRRSSGGHGKRGKSGGRSGKSGKIHKSSRRDHKTVETIRPPSLWNVYCAIITFWFPDFLLRSCCKKVSKEQQRAWREKMGLISIILLIMTFVGFLTFGFNQVVCNNPSVRLRVNEVDSGYMIFHGVAYDLSTSRHPAAEGIPSGSNVLYDLPEKHGGQDGSFLFQNVNGKCKDLITLASNSDVPTDSSDNLAWYFPCNTFNQDGSSEVNLTIPYYLGYACHTTAASRSTFYTELHGTADVYFTWDDVKNSSRNLIVYSGNVLDLNLLYWFNETEVTIPDRFKELRDNTDRKSVV